MTRKLKLNNKFRKNNKTQNKKNKNLKKLQTRNKNAKNNKIKKMRSKKLKGGLSFGDVKNAASTVYNYSKGNVQSINDYRIWTYFTKRFFNIGIGMEDIYIDRFIARNQDFSTLMNQKFVKDMDVRDNFLFIYVTSVNYAFNDSYNIPFTEPILFELFDMAKFRLKKIYTISLPIIINLLNSTEINEVIKNQDKIIANNKSILPETISGIFNIFKNNPVMNLINKNRRKITDNIIISPRYRLFVYFFTELRKMLKTVKIVVEAKRIKEDRAKNDDSDNDDEDDEDDEEYIQQVVKLETDIKNNNDNLTFENQKTKILNAVNYVLNDKTENNDDENMAVNENNNDITESQDVNDVVKNNSNLQKINEMLKNFSRNIGLKSLIYKADDYLTNTTKTKILSKLNKYIDVGDLIYTHFENKSPFYTKKEAIIYFTRLLLNNDKDIDLYDDNVLLAKLNQLYIDNKLNDKVKEINREFLDNNKAYKFLNDYINNTKFDKTKPVNFNDVLYSKEGRSISEVENANRIDDTINNNNDNVFDIVGNNMMILSNQKEIINRLHTIIANKIDEKNLNLDNLEYSFIISYKKMIENRRDIITQKLDIVKDIRLATEVYKFRKTIKLIGLKSVHYNCSSPTNFLSMFFSQLTFYTLFNLMGTAVGFCYLALNCIVSGFIFYTINYIFG